MPIMSTNFAKTLVWKHEYDVKLWRHKKRTPNTNDHHLSLNEPPQMKIFCVRHWKPRSWKTDNGGWISDLSRSPFELYPIPSSHTTLPRYQRKRPWWKFL